MIRVLLVRHCESSGQAPDAHLTDVGFEQADRLVPFLSRFEIDCVVSSPYQRALQTITPFAQHRSLVIREDARLRERELSTIALRDWLDHLERSYADLDYRHPTGESGREAQQRGWQAIDETLEAPHPFPVIVAHGNLIALILSRIDPSIGFEFWRQLSNPDVYLLEREVNSSWTNKRVWNPDLLPARESAS